MGKHARMLTMDELGLLVAFQDRLVPVRPAFKPLHERLCYSRKRDPLMLTEERKLRGLYPC